MVITIDGLSTNGKTTLAKKISEKIGFKNFNTGAVYRCIALTILNNELNIDNIETVMRYLENFNVDFNNNNIFLNGQNVTKSIYTEEINYYSTKWANIAEIKDFVKNCQQKYLEKYNVVMEGRNIGTKIAPNAEIKFYLYSDFETRVYRKWKANENVNIEDIRKEIKIIDSIETENKLFVKPESAIEIDTSNKSIDEIYKIMLEEIYKKVNI